MEKLQKQIHNLDSRVEQLHGVVQRLSTQIADLSMECHPANHTHNLDPQVFQGINLTHSEGPMARPISEHKDILLDEIGSKSVNSQSEQDLAPEIQIRRLTAQLTAAYNRIAALEEQLLTQRSKSY